MHGLRRGEGRLARPLARFTSQQETLPVLQLSWGRQSPRPLVSMQPSGKVYWMKPGLDYVTGMTGASWSRPGGTAATLLPMVPAPSLKPEPDRPPACGRLVPAICRGASRPG